MTKSVLIIESDLDTSILVAEALMDAGWTTFSAYTAGEGLILVEKIKPVLIILNLFVKGSGGFEYTARLRERHEATDIPILLLADEDREFDPGYKERYGVVDFLKKPPGPEELLEKVRDAVYPDNVPLFAPPEKKPEPALLSEGLEAKPEPPGTGAEERPAEPEAAGLPVISQHERTARTLKIQNETGPAIRDEQSRKNYIRPGTLFLVSSAVLAIIAGLIYLNIVQHEKAAPVPVRMAMGPDAGAVRGKRMPETAAEKRRAAPAPAARERRPEIFDPSRQTITNNTLKEYMSHHLVVRRLKNGTAEKKPKAAARDPRIHAVQLGVFSSREDAEKISRTCSRMFRINAYIKEDTRSGQTVYRVLAGEFKSMEEAGRLSGRLRANGMKSVIYTE